MQLVRPEFYPDRTADRATLEALQRRLARHAHFDGDPTAGRSLDDLLIAGIDQAFDGDEVISAVVCWQGGDVIDTITTRHPVSMPYIPGLLSFREGAAIVRTLSDLDQNPDLLLIDGSGRIHFREAGLATHIGVLYDIPAIGVIKSLLCGTLLDPPPAPFPVGTIVPIVADHRMTTDTGTIVGYAVQTRQYRSSSRSINPIYVSPGHRITAKRSAEIALDLTGEYKLPEPIRLADALADRTAHHD